MTNQIRLDIQKMLDETYKAIAISLESSIPSLKLLSGHNNNDAFILSSYAEYWAVDKGFIVISLDIQASGSNVHITGYIARESGLILNDITDIMISDAEVVDCVKDFAAKCKEEVPLMRQELLALSRTHPDH